MSDYLNEVEAHVVRLCERGLCARKTNSAKSMNALYAAHPTLRPTPTPPCAELQVTVVQGAACTRARGCPYGAGGGRMSSHIHQCGPVPMDPESSRVSESTKRKDRPEIEMSYSESSPY